MARPDQTVAEQTAAMLAAAGIVSTPEGRAAARAKLDAARARATPEAMAKLRAKLGLPPAATA